MEKNIYNCINDLKSSIDSARPEDAGVYSVEVSNKLGDVSGQAKVEIEPSEKRPVFISDLHDTEGVEGFPVKFEIKVIGHPQPKLKWLHNGDEIKPDGHRVKITQNPDGTAALIIDKATEDDAGEYKVIASNEVGACTSQARLTVHSRIDDRYAEEAPRFVSGLRDANTDEGQALELSAPFIANPVPDIIWSKDGKPLIPDDRIMMTCDGKRVGLIINPANVNDSGVYTCLLANPIGEDMSKCNANVRKIYKKPYFSLRLFDQPAVLNLDAKLPVRVHGVPYPELTWTFNNLPIKNNSKYTIKHDGDNSILHVRSCTLEDIGTYRCVAKNLEGEDSTQAHMDVVDKM